MPLQSNPTESVIPVRYGHGIRVTASFVTGDFQPVATHRIGVSRLDPLATAVGTPFSFTAPEAAADEFDITHDTEYEIDGNPHFVDQSGVPTLLVNSTTFANQGEFYIVGVVEVATGYTVDFVLVYIEKTNLSVFDSATQTVDEDVLNIAMAMAGHNSKFKQISYAQGQPSTSKIERYNNGLETLSVLPDDFEDTSGKAGEETYLQVIDSIGDIIETRGGE